MQASVHPFAFRATRLTSCVIYCTPCVTLDQADCWMWCNANCALMHIRLHNVFQDACCDEPRLIHIVRLDSV